MNARIVRFAVGKCSRAIDLSVRWLARDAWRHVSLIRQRFDRAGVRPHDIRGATDLERVPIGSRLAMTAAPRAESLREGVNLATCDAATTSGTTGVPLAVYMSRTEALYRRLLLFRALARYGRFRFPFTVAELGSGAIRPDLHQSDVTQRTGLVRVTRIPRTLPPDAQADALLQAKPQVVTGHPSCLQLVAERIADSRALDKRWPKLVAARGEILHEETRLELRRAFGCPVVDLYNCEEIGNVAWECPRTAGVMHVNTDACVLEIVDEEGAPARPGEEGRVIVTNLFNRTMPFIRHELGDRAALRGLGTCDCGHSGPSMTLVAGRPGDFIRLRSGERVSPRTVYSLLARAVRRENEPAAFDVRCIAAVQESVGELTVRFVPWGEQARAVERRIRSELETLDPDLLLTIEPVSEIRPEETGKLRYVRSDIRDTSGGASPRGWKSIERGSGGRGSAS